LTVEIKDSQFNQNNNMGAYFADNVAGTVTGSSFSKNNNHGALVEALLLGATNHMTFRNCVFSANFRGIITSGNGINAAFTQITDSEVSDSVNAGVTSQTASIVTLSNTTVARNGTGLFVSGGTIRSFQDNRVYGNTTDGSFTSNIGKL